MPVTANDETDCDGEYKVSYLEKAGDYYFVGAGLCLGDDTDNAHDARVANLQRLVHLAMTNQNGLNPLDDSSNDADLYTSMETVCGTYAHANISSIRWIGNNLNDENGELYLFIAELVDDTTVGTAGVGTVSSVKVSCHPASSVEQDDFSTADEQEGEKYIRSYG